MSDTQKQSGVKNVNFKLDESTHKQLRHLALDHALTLKDFVKTILIERVQQETKQ
jgi:predicted HicB family RNase H-like nuclease